MDSTITALLEAVQLLTKPEEKGQALGFDDILQRKTHAVCEKLLIPDISDLDLLGKDANRDSDIRWRFTCLCLYVLVTLRDTVMLACEEYNTKLKSGKFNPDSPPPPSPDLFSVQQQKAIQSCMQFVVSLGVLPYLLPGVGVPVEQRMGSTALSQLSQPEAVGDLEKYNRLVEVTQILLRCLNQPTLGSLILCRHLGDILASLCQLSYVPLKKPDSANVGRRTETQQKTEHEAEGKEEQKQEAEANAAVGKKHNEEICYNASFVMTLELWEKIQKERKHFQQALMSLLDRVYQPMAVKELLLLQGPPSTGTAKQSRLKAPTWLQKASGHLLSSRLMKKRGVISVIQGVLDLSSHRSDTTVDWKKLEVVARLIASPPSQNITVEEYYKTVCPQVIDLLSLQDELLGKQYVRVASSCTLALSQRSETMSKNYIFNVIMEPLYRCCAGTESDKESGTVSVSEEELSLCIQNLYRCFVLGTDPCSLFLMNLTPVMLLLFHIHCAIRFSVAYLKGQIEELILRYIKHCEPKLILQLFRSFAFNEEVHGVQKFNYKVRFSVGPSGGVKASQIDESEETNFFVIDDENAVCLVDILLGINDNTLVSEFFLQLLQDLTSVLGESAVELEPQSVNSEEELLLIEKQVDQSILLLRKSLMVIRLLSLLSESDVLLGTMLQNTCQLITFVQATLDRGAKLCEIPERAESGVMATESLIMAMNILLLLTPQKTLKSSEWEMMKKTLEPLKVLMSSYPDEKVQSLAEKLSLNICTRGAVQDFSTGNQNISDNQSQRKTGKQFSQVLPQAAAATNVSSACGDVQNEPNEENHVPKDESSTSVKNSSDTVSEDKRSEFQKAMDEIQDPLLPVCGHGLLSLSKLMLLKDEEAIKEQELILHIFMEHLEHPDSYIYSVAIQGLVSMAIVFPDRVVLTLTKEYGLFNRQETFKSKSSEIRMKIGEALVRVIKLLGEVTPKYKGPLLNSFLVCARDSDSLIRASSLSNLGEACKALRFSLGPVANELLSCLDALMHTDPDIEVRRAAVLVVTLLLQGLGDDALKMLEDNLLELYRGLKCSYQTETDSIFRLHVLLALEELDRIARTCLFPEQTLLKKINVLNLPDS